MFCKKCRAEIKNPASNVNVFASMISHQALSDISAVTDERGYYKLECPPGLYRISADGIGYKEYRSNKKIVVTSDTETINDTIVLEKIKKSTLNLN
ncbi:MAG: carboxypeptidase-like regulatory domain-containing protein [Oscillospiraceae bacterium]|nr:carboxypeptidase-like regulatory domain-containing protein [Oscillospiraceae bacterium]